jgi:transposase InsO family protein
MVGALACVAGVAHVWQVRLPLRTITRSALVAAMAYALGTLWPAAGAALLLKLVLACAAITVAFLLLGELTRDELRQLRALARRASLQALLLRRTAGQSNAPQAVHREK